MRQTTRSSASSKARCLCWSGTWIDAPAGSTIVIPAGVTHDFANRTDVRACLFNVFIPGGFEQNMPAIVNWYEENG